MKKTDPTKSVWYERYKPSTVDDLIIPDYLKQSLNVYVDTQNLPNLGLFCAEPGCGKSCTAHSIITDLGGESLWINASLEKGIDVLRGKIMSFASQNSFDDNVKVVVMDEFDNFSQDGQKAFRGFIDEYSENCRFIFTGNYKEKIIQPLLDRLEIYDFNAFSKEELIKPVFDRLRFILDKEHVSYVPKDLVPVINTYYPRIRSMVGTLQKFSQNHEFKLRQGELDDVGVFDAVMRVTSVNTYLDMIQAVNALNSPDNLFTFLFKNAQQYFKPEAYPNVIVACAKYQSYASTVRDKHLNCAACLTEIMQYRI